MATNSHALLLEKLEELDRALRHAAHVYHTTHEATGRDSPDTKEALNDLRKDALAYAACVLAVEAMAAGKGIPL